MYEGLYVDDSVNIVLYIDVSDLGTSFEIDLKDAHDGKLFID